MSPRRLVAYGVVGVALVLAVLGLSRWLGARDALRDARYELLADSAAALATRYSADSATLRRQLRAVQPSVDSAKRLRERGDSIRRRVVIVDTTRDTVAVSDTVVVDQRIKDILEADAATISQQARAIVRLEVALASDTLARQRLERLAELRAEQISILQSKIPSRRWQTVKLVAAFGAGVYLGAQSRRL